MNDEEIKRKASDLASRIDCLYRQLAYATPSIERLLTEALTQVRDQSNLMPGYEGLGSHDPDVLEQAVNEMLNS